VTVYEKPEGEPLIRLFFEGQDDSLQIRAAEIFSPRFRTASGLGVDASYKAWREKYPVDHVETTLNHVVAFVPSLHATLTFPYRALADNAQHNPAVKPDVSAIKPDAKPESITVFFDRTP